MTKKTTTEPKAPDTFRAIVSADYFRRAMVACSSEDSRYYLQGVYVTTDPRGGAILAATDGHMLVVIRDPKAICRGSGIVKLNKAMRAALTSKTPSGFFANTGPYLLVDQNPERQSQSRAYVAHMDDSLATPGYSTKIDVDQPYSALASIFDTMDGRVVAYQGYDLLIDGAFPDFRRVVPKALPGSILPPTISAKVMNQLYTALTTGAKGKPLGHLTFFQCDEGETATEVSSPIMAIPGTLDGEPFEAFGIAMPMRASSAKNAPPLWWLHFMTPESGGPKRKTGGLSDADVEHLKGSGVMTEGQVRFREDAARREAKLAEDVNAVRADLSGVEAQKAVMAPTTPETSETPATPQETGGNCHADRDGDCSHKDCPQNRDGEPQKTGRHCPLDKSPPEDED